MGELNVGFDAKRAFLNRSGLGNYSRNLINGFQTVDLTLIPHLFTPRIDSMLADELTLNNAQIHQPVGIGKILNAYWRTYRISKSADNLKLDLYHGLSNELPVGIENVCPSVVTIHDLIFLRYPDTYPWLDRKIYERKFLSAANRSDHIIATSEQTANDIMKFYGIDSKKITVVYQCCHPRFRHTIDDPSLEQVRKMYQLPEQFVLSVGAFHPRKNQALILSALKEAKTDEALSLVLVGSGPMEKTLRKQASQLGLQDRVHFLTNVGPADLPALYKAASMFIYPSHFEGFGIPVLEGMTCGTPVITSDNSLREVGGDAVAYIDPTDPMQLTEKIQEILKNDLLRSEMVEKGKEQSRKFSQRHFAEETMAVYKNVLK